MSYTATRAELPLFQEAALPHRKCRRRWGVLGLLTLALAPQLPAEPLPLAQQLETYARDRLSRYLESLNWEQAEPQIAVWLPEGANHLPACQQAVAIAPASQTGRPWGRQLYRLSCPQPVWELSGRVDLSLQLPVLVARHDLPKNHLLQDADLQPKTLEVSRLIRDFTTNPADLLGRKTVRRIRVGQLLEPSQLQAALLVHKGDLVLIRAGSDGFAATMQGEALEEGGKGDGIKVRNSSSGRVIQGWVVEKGVVETRF